MSINRTLLVVLIASLAVVGCSKDKNKSRNLAIKVEVTAGQQDISKALIRSSEILISGQPNESNEGILNTQSFYTNDKGTAQAIVFPGKLQFFELVTLAANPDINQVASVSRCQWVGGCNGKDFAADINTAYQWQSVAWDLRKNERLTVTPLTHLAAVLAFNYAYAETPSPDPVLAGETPVEQESLWQETGYYSPYSVEQAISQVSTLFGILNVQSSFAADLSRINSLSVKDPVSARDSVRYGALLAAWAHLQEINPSFTKDVTQDFLSDKAQLLQKSQPEEPKLTLEKLYTLAKDNLEQLPIHNSKVKSLVADVVSAFEIEISQLQDNQLTAVRPQSIESLFGSAAFDNYNLGIKRAKNFVEELQQQSKYFFGDSYNDLINSYLDEQKAFFKENKEDFNQVISLLQDAQKIYIESYNAAACVSASSWAACAYDSSSHVLTLTDASSQQITLLMKNVADNKQAVDIEMTGALQVNNLIFKLKNTDSSQSRVRLFYAEEANQVLASAIEPIGYEYQWASFTFYDLAKKDREWTGNFNLLYRGVTDPSGMSSEQHFNIDTLRLNSRISDAVEDNGEQDKNASTVFVAAKSSTASTYYNDDPAEKFGKINGFFSEQTTTTAQTKASLVSFKFGEEKIYDQIVKYFDYYIDDDNAKSYRYRFYPDVVRNQNVGGQYTVGKNESITTHNLAICPLAKNESGEWVVDPKSTCSPMQAFNGKRNLQKSINNLWQAGVFSYVDIPGKGEYFVTLPSSPAGTESCHVLEDLSGNVGVGFDGELVSSAVLGLDLLRVTTEVILEGQPRTLLDVLVNAPTTDRFNVTASLSHNYSSLNEDKVFVGSGSNLNRLIFNYNTDSSFKRIGDFSVYMSGVVLADSKLDAEIMAGLNQSYTSLPHKYITASNGGQQLCVTANEPLGRRIVDEGMKKDSVYSLAFRGVVYGSIRNERGIWIARFIDGTWVPLTPN